MIRLLPLFIACFLCVKISASNTRPILWNIDRLEEVKRNDQVDRSALFEKADELCNTKPVVVTNKVNCISGDIHNYESLSSYYWPDPNNPTGPYIDVDGKLNPEVSEYDRTKIDLMASNLKCLCIAYYLSSERKYYNAFVHHLCAWFIDKKTRMLPNFEYAQIIKGKNNNHGQPHGIIDAYVLTDVLDAIRLMDSLRPIKKRYMKDLRSWMSSFSKWLATSSLGIRESQQKNNHGPSYDALLFDMAIFSDDKAMADSISRNFKSKRLDVLIKDDGSQPSELRRTRAFHYSALSLSFMIDFCIMQQAAGRECLEYYEPLSKACFFLAAFIGHKDKFQNQEISDWKYNEDLVRLDIDRLIRLSGGINLLDNKIDQFNYYKDYKNWIK